MTAATIGVLLVAALLGEAFFGYVIGRLVERRGWRALCFPNEEDE